MVHSSGLLEVISVSYCSNKDEEEAEDDQIEEYEDEDGETRERKKSSQVPWKQVSGSQSQPAPPVEVIGEVFGEETSV